MKKWVDDNSLWNGLAETKYFIGQRSVSRPTDFPRNIPDPRQDGRDSSVDSRNIRMSTPELRPVWGNSNHNDPSFSISYGQRSWNRLLYHVVAWWESKLWSTSAISFARASTGRFNADLIIGHDFVPSLSALAVPHDTDGSLLQYIWPWTVVPSASPPSGRPLVPDVFLFVVLRQAGRSRPRRKGDAVDLKDGKVIALGIKVPFGMNVDFLDGNDFLSERDCLASVTTKLVIGSTVRITSVPSTEVWSWSPRATWRASSGPKWTTQWAAVRTWQGAMMVPPQNVSEPASFRPTCQGYSWRSASLPFTILSFSSSLNPQSQSVDSAGDYLMLPS